MAKEMVVVNEEWAARAKQLELFVAEQREAWGEQDVLEADRAKRIEAKRQVGSQRAASVEGGGCGGVGREGSNCLTVLGFALLSSRARREKMEGGGVDLGS